MAMHKKYDGCCVQPLLLLGRKEGEKPHEDAGESVRVPNKRERVESGTYRDSATIDTLDRYLYSRLHIIATSEGGCFSLFYSKILLFMRIDYGEDPTQKLMPY